MYKSICIQSIDLVIIKMIDEIWEIKYIISIFWLNKQADAYIYQTFL